MSAIVRGIGIIRLLSRGKPVPASAGCLRAPFPRRCEGVSRLSCATREPSGPRMRGGLRLEVNRSRFPCAVRE